MPNQGSNEIFVGIISSPKYSNPSSCLSSCACFYGQPFPLLQFYFPECPWISYLDIGKVVKKVSKPYVDKYRENQEQLTLFEFLRKSPPILDMKCNFIQRVSNIFMKTGWYRTCVVCKTIRLGFENNNTNENT